MSALTTDVSIKGNGLKFNVRSYKLERVLDLSMVNLAAAVTSSDVTTNTYYEIGDLPKGFVPRNVAIVELKKQVTSTTESAAKIGVYLKSDSAKLVERTLGTADGITVGQVSGKNLDGAGDTLCVTVDKTPTNGKVKVVVSGDVMTGAFDEGEKRDSYDEAEHVLTNKITNA